MKPGNNIQALSGSGCITVTAVIVLGTFPVAMMEAYILVTGLIVVSGECLWAYTYVLRPSWVYKHMR